MTRRSWMAVLLALCACATSSSSSGKPAAGETLAEAEGDILVGAEGRFISTSIHGNTLRGGKVDVTLEPGTARGTARGAAVDLSLAQGEVVGAVGERETRLRVQSQSGGLSAEGLLFGQPSSFKLSPNVLAGNFASCRYDLQRSNRASAAGGVGVGGSGVGVDYSGEHRCGGAAQRRITVTLPSGFDELTPAQQATILSLVLMEPELPGTDNPKPRG